nr:hypothetical protein [Pirellula staleyi]
MTASFSPMRGIALLSASLDSQIALLLAREAGIELTALHFAGFFTRHTDRVVAFCQRHAVPLSIVDADAIFYDSLRHRRFGDDNVMLDIRMAMFRNAKKLLSDLETDAVLVTGEVAGQRKGTQTIAAFETIDRHTRLERQVLRPLSAKLLVPLIPAIDRRIQGEEFLGLSGRTRKELLPLAERFALTTMPGPSHLTNLYDEVFVERLLHAFRLTQPIEVDELRLLEAGKLLVTPAHELIVLGRSQVENEGLARFANSDAAQNCVLITPRNFVGPMALVRSLDERAHRAAAELVVKSSKQSADLPAVVEIHYRGTSREFTIERTSDLALAVELKLLG